MPTRIIKPPKPPKFHRPEGAANFDNMDDFNFAKSVNTQQGTIQHTPTQDKDIVNKEYVDGEIGSHTHTSSDITNFSSAVQAVGDARYIEVDGTSTTSAQIPFARGISVSSDSEVVLSVSDANKDRVTIGSGVSGSNYHLLFDGAGGDGTITWNNASQAFAIDKPLFIDSYIHGGAGSASAPTYSFTFDGDSGMYSVSANALGFALNSAVEYTFAVDSITFGNQKGSPTLTYNDNTQNITIGGSLTATGLITAQANIEVTSATPVIIFTDTTASADDYTIGASTNDAWTLRNTTAGRNELTFAGSTGNATFIAQVDAASYAVGGSAGASGSFTTADVPPKTVTVTNGIITSIV